MDKSEALSVALVEQLDIAAGYLALVNPASGAINVFVGTVRNSTQSRAVRHLTFEAYAPMARKEMQKIARAAVRDFALHRAVIWHVVGVKAVGEPVVFIGATAPHRDAAFQACRYMIDTLKETVPIWKKEHFADGEVWVNAHP